MDFDAAMMRPIGLPALARCALDGTLRTSTSNRCSLSCSSRCFQRCPACSCSWNTATTRSGRWWRLHYNISCTRLVKWTPRVPASPALPALPHTQYTHTQSHNRRHGSRLGAGRRGWDAAEQRSRGRLAAARREARQGGRGRRRTHTARGRLDSGHAERWLVVENSRADSGDEGSSSSVARRAVRRAAVDMTTATTTAACTRARAARALYTLQQGPRSTKRAPSTAIEFQRARAPCFTPDRVPRFRFRPPV